MAFWLIKEYAHAASTLVEEASKDSIQQLDHFTERLLSDIFNFYAFLRRHPLVVRQRLTHAGIQLSSTEQFLVFAKEIGNRVTPSERRLYFRTAATHMASGCPLLALDVLSRLPKNISSILQSDSEYNESLKMVIFFKLKFLDNFKNKKNVFKQAAAQNTTNVVSSFNKNGEEKVDWSASTTLANEELELKWSDEEGSGDEQICFLKKKNCLNESNKSKTELSIEIKEEKNVQYSSHTIDFIAQHLKFIAILRIMMDEMATLASGFEIDGGQLRFELFKWLERECTVLREICDFSLETKDFTADKEENFDDLGLENLEDRYFF